MFNSGPRTSKVRCPYPQRVRCISQREEGPSNAGWRCPSQGESETTARETGSIPAMEWTLGWKQMEVTTVESQASLKS